MIKGNEAIIITIDEARKIVNYLGRDIFRRKLTYKKLQKEDMLSIYDDLKTIVKSYDSMGEYEIEIGA